MLSSIVTVASQVDVLPFASVTVSVTVCAPTLVQSNVWSAPPPIVRVTGPQLSTAAVVDLRGRDGHGAGGVKLDRDVLTDGCRGDVVLDRHGRIAGRCVAVRIGHGQGHRLCAYTGAVERLVRSASDGQGHRAAVVDCCRCRSART
jgi:hypothetical protein